MEFLTKPFRTRGLLDAIRAAVERDRDTLKERAEIAQLRSCYDLLTPREREVLIL
jgi:FixJ family two-component response regulator